MNLRPLQRFFATPKGMLTIILAALIAVAAPHYGAVVWPSLGAACFIAGAVDAVILRLRSKQGKWEYPSGAVLTAMIVTMVLRPQEPWYVTSTICVLAILSKYVLRYRTANIFNPAALAIVGTFYYFHTGQSWWGALPEMPLYVQPLLLLGGVFIAQRINKMPLVLAFLGTHFVLFTLIAFFGDPQRVAEIYRAPDLHAALYFALIILTDPPTSPTKYPDQIYCGILTAVTSFVIFEWLGVVYFFLAGVLVGNLWEVWRRYSRNRSRREPAVQLS